MSAILAWIISILATVMIIYIVIWNFVHFIYAIKCFRIWQCSNDKCRFKFFCTKYMEPYTKEDIEKIHQFLDEAKKRL